MSHPQRRASRAPRPEAPDSAPGRARPFAEGTVDLWLEDDYNAASRMPAGRPYGASENVAWSGKIVADPDVAVHRVSIKRARAAPCSAAAQQLAGHGGFFPG